MVEIDTSKPVLVTGATGYVAGWIVKELLERGATVHATVRDPSNRRKYAHLDAVASQSPGSIRYFAADLLERGSFADAMDGCSVVFHTASPYKIRIRDPQKELVDPALEGTRNVLRTVDETASVHRVVLTSSVVATFGDAADLEGRPATEDDWNETSSLEHHPYSYSKVLAEKEAWKIAEAQDRWRLVVINPSLVVGPSLNEGPTESESFRLVAQMGDGTMRTGTGPFPFGVVDVRDLALAHVAAGFLPDAEGRHLVSGHDTDYLQMSNILKKEFGKRFPFAPMGLPKAMIWLVGPILDRSLTRKMVSRNLGHPLRIDNRKSRERLGVSYRPLEESMVEMFTQMIERGTFDK